MFESKNELENLSIEINLVSSLNYYIFLGLAVAFDIRKNDVNPRTRSIVINFFVFEAKIYVLKY